MSIMELDSDAEETPVANETPAANMSEDDAPEASISDPNGDSAPSDVAQKGAGFTILHAHNKRRQPAVKAALPDWLAKPNFFDGSLAPAGLQQLADVAWLPDDVRQRLAAPPLRLTTLFPVQAALAPVLLAEYGSERASWRRPRDLCVAAATGSGKTLGYGLPLLLLLRGRCRVALRALVVLPVRELAIQVHQVLRQLFGEELHVGLAVAGRCSLAAECRTLLDWDTATETWAWRVDVLVATPGRLADHLLATSGFCLRRLHLLVVDEADRVMQEDKHSWIGLLRRRLARPPPAASVAGALGWCDQEPVAEAQLPLHQLLFSATLTHEPAPLMRFGLHHPRLFVARESGAPLQAAAQPKAALTVQAAGSFVAPEGLEEWYVQTTPELKPALLAHLLCQRRLAAQRVLLFANSRESAGRLCLFLQQFQAHMTRCNDAAADAAAGVGQQRAQIAAREASRDTYRELLTNLSVFELNGRLPIDKQHRILSRFNKSAGASLLVCSDAVARGIDVPQVDCVINYEAPMMAKTYVHRAGRASRAGRPGQAYTFLDRRQVRPFRLALKSAGRLKLRELHLYQRHWKCWLEPCRQALQGLRSSLEQTAQRASGVGEKAAAAPSSPSKGRKRKHAAKVEVDASSDADEEDVTSAPSKGRKRKHATKVEVDASSDANEEDVTSPPSKGRKRKHATKVEVDASSDANEEDVTSPVPIKKMRKKKV